MKRFVVLDSETGEITQELGENIDGARFVAIHEGEFVYHRSTNPYKDFAKLLTDEEKGIVDKAFNALDEVFGNYNEDDGWIIRCCIISNLTDCFLNNKLSSFCDICDYILDNESLILDDIKLNDLFDREDDTISERMIKIVEKGMSSKIR